MNEGQQAEAGDGSVIVQIQGNGSIVSVDLPHLELTRRTGLSRRIGNDPETGKPIETHVIRPFARAIELVGREAELAGLRCWLKSEPPVSVRVLTGEAGLGKTRLALELAEEAAECGWRAGFLTRQNLMRFLKQTNLAAWGWNAPVLAVVDYASASASDLNAWLLQLVDHRIWNGARTRPDRPLRLLLLERHATPGAGWWTETFRGGDGASPEEMLDPREPVALRRTDEPEQRLEILKQTLTRLGGDLTLPEDADFERRVAELTWGGVPLLLMMAAVTAARENFGAALALSSDNLALNIAKNELSRIRKVVRGNHVKRVLAPLVDHVVAVATLRQGLSIEAALDVIETEAAALGYALPHGPEPLREALATALPAANRGVAAIEPDMIGEALLLAAWGTDRRAGVPAAQKDGALPAIRRAHGASPAAVMETIIRTCQDYLIHGHHDPLDWLRLIFEERTGGPALIELANAMPEATVQLRELALEVSQSAADLMERLAREHTEDAEVRAAYAGHLNDLSNRLFEAGQRNKALEAARKAVTLHRALAAQRSDAFRHALAVSLNSLSNCLSAVGRGSEALHAARESADIRRALADERPDAFRHLLAGSLNNLSNRLSEIGQREEALDAAEQSVGLSRTLEAEQPDAFRHLLATSLNSLSNHLSAVGQREEALVAAREAVELRRALAAERPDAFRQALATSLIVLSNRLSEVGCRDRALDAITNAVAIYCKLAAEHPDAFRLLLATSLNNLSNRLSEAGRREDALDAAKKAVALLRMLAAEHPDAFRYDLAASLNNLSNRLSAVGQREEALDAAENAVGALGGPFLTAQTALAPWIVQILRNYIIRCTEAGRAPKPDLMTPIDQALDRQHNNRSALHR